MKLIIAILSISLFIGCSLSPKQETASFLKYPPELEEVHNLLIKRKHADARHKIDDYLNKAENIHWYGHAYYLKGFLFELDEDFPNAIKHYRSAIQHGSKYESRVEAKALYNLSFVYERLDQRDELLTSLIDLMKRRSFFDVLTGQVEIPARLAAAYASQKKMKEALIFHREAERNFNDMVRNQKFRSSRPEISKSLHYLGLATFDENDEEFDQLVKKLEVGQKYFLASAEASKSSWSKKSSERLQALYDKAWGMVLQFSPKGFENDPLAAKKQTHRKQLVMASHLYDLMFKLRAEEFPMGKVNPRSKALIDVTGSWIGRIEKFAMTLQVGPETVRSKTIKNKRLAKYVEEKKEKVKVNKEQSEEPLQMSKKPTPPPTESEKALRAKDNIGKDPNL